MPDWQDMFVPTLSIAEVVARATIMYFFLFLALRFLLKRQGGTLNIADLLVVVAIVDGAQPAFNGEAHSITESVLFVVTIIFWSFSLNWIGYRFRALRFLTAAQPMTLVKDGRICPDAMRRALMTKDELLEQMRQHGYGRVDQVRAVIMEGDGEISVIGKDDG